MRSFDLKGGIWKFKTLKETSREGVRDEDFEGFEGFEGFQGFQG